MSSGTLREQAYQYIQSRILSGEIVAGSRISELQLAEEMGISRTPIRSAIRELESEGLVEQVARYGTIVKKADRRDLAEIYETRVALEGYSAELAATQITPKDLGLLNALCDQMHAEIVEIQKTNQDRVSSEVLERFVRADIQFHMIILRATGNRRIMKSVSGSRLLAHWGHAIPHTASMLKRFWDEHRKVAHALRKGQSELARRLMIDHIRQAKDGALKIFDEIQANSDAEDALKWMFSDKEN
ncbi:MAG: DNA-binding GntR family transcriptional regulator [Pirellulaceae bacterium]|jgi:DNA-binding GntR family transcriptional regulator